VRETLSFAARLKLPSRMTSEQKERRVDEVRDFISLYLSRVELCLV
jgi:ABC-type multidrug transport system ATPase subunit